MQIHGSLRTIPKFSLQCPRIHTLTHTHKNHDPSSADSSRILSAQTLSHPPSPAQTEGQGLTHHLPYPPSSSWNKDRGRPVSRFLHEHERSVGLACKQETQEPAIIRQAPAGQSQGWHRPTAIICKGPGKQDQAADGDRTVHAAQDLPNCQF